MKNIILAFHFGFIFFSCEDSINSDTEISPILSVESLTEYISPNELMTISIHIKNLEIPVFGVYLKIVTDTSKIEIIDNPGFQIGEFWNENSIIFEKIERGIFHLTLVNTDTQSKIKTDGKIGEFSVKALTFGSTEIILEKDECEFFDSQGELIEIKELIIESLNLNIN